MKVICKGCDAEIQDSVAFCPHCGKETGFGVEVINNARKARIYIASFVLSPLGLYWFFKFFKSDDLEKRKLAFTSLIITAIPLLLSLIIGSKLIKSFNSNLEIYNANVQMYSELGL
ncbi:hypothetical protein ACFL0C_01535 [Patescibacteria group bacterium]